MSKKIIAVTGATGSQGGGLARAILDDPDGPFLARALTRNPDSAPARELAARGAEVVAADLDDEASIRAAFDGAYGAFVVTNFWQQDPAGRSSARMELDQAAGAARAARAAGLRHVVWSTLEDTRPHLAHLGSDAPVLDGGYRVPHFDAKGEANAFFLAEGVPTTFLETTFFYEAFLGPFGPRRGPDGRLTLTVPIGDSRMSLVASEDIGRTAHGIFAAGSRFVGRTIGLAGTHATGEELAALFTKTLGEPVEYRPDTPAQVRAAGFPGADDIGSMFQFYAEASDSFVTHRDLGRARAINPRLQPLEDWLAAHRDRIAAAL